MTRYGWLRRRLTTLPTGSDWLECLLWGALLAGAGWLLPGPALTAGDPPPLHELVRVAAVAMLLPAFCEELVFRGLLLPQAGFRCGLPSTLAFIAWHPTEAWLWLPAAWPTFSDPRFLALACLLSLACIRLVGRSRSLWPAVLLHWALVVAWKAAGGARFVA